MDKNLNQIKTEVYDKCSLNHFTTNNPVDRFSLESFLAKLQIRKIAASTDLINFTLKEIGF